MRRIVLSLLLASAAASPALAQDRGDDHGHHQQARAERANNGDNANRSQQQQSPPQNAARPEQRQAVAQGQRGGFDRSQLEQRQAVAQGQRRGFDRAQFERGRQQQVQVQQQQQQVQVQQQPAYGYRGYNGGYAGAQRVQGGQYARPNGYQDARSWNQQGGDYRQRQVVQQQIVQQQIVRQQYAQQQAYQRNQGTSGGWNRDWRNDRRYDWRNYRERNRSIFRLGVYFDPFGYGYRSFDIGYQLQSVYFGQQYWIDPAMYELPYPPPGTQWVRYWNDALLVDMYSGQVVDVIHNFFW